MAYFDKYGVEFSDDRKTLVRCPEDFTGEYEIPDSVIEIGENAFFGCSGLTFVTIPNSVMSIGSQAFFNCIGLSSVDIPNNCICIEAWAFQNCTSLISVTFPNSVTSIGRLAFNNCIGLTAPLYNAHVFAFMPKTYSGSYAIPNGIEYIAGGAFQDCNGLTSIKIPQSVTSIGENAFFRCSKLNSVTIPNSVTSIENSAFIGCCGLTSIIVEKGNTIYDSRNDCNAIIETVSNTLISGCKNTIIPNGVTSIGDFAFDECSSLSAITIPNSVTRIGSWAFDNCISLISITISNGVKIIGDQAFAGCRSLTSITIPNSVMGIGEYAFRGCNKLKEICVPLGQEERFCDMFESYYFTEIIRKTSENKKAILRQREAEEQRRMQEQQMQEMLQGSILFFDTETTGTPRNYKAPISDSYNWPRLVQLAWIMADKNGNILKKKSHIIRPSGFTIPSDAAAVHGITTERAQREGQPLDTVMEEFMNDVQLAASVVGHNIDFDMHIVGAELYRLNMDYGALMDKPCICTMKSSTDFCAIPNPNTYFGGYKWPSLQELYCKLFGHEFSDAHDALADITATKDCFFELKRRGII